MDRNGDAGAGAGPDPGPDRPSGGDREATTDPDGDRPGAAVPDGGPAVDPRERRYLERGRVGRLATADAEGRPSAVPVCYAVLDPPAGVGRGDDPTGTDAMGPVVTPVDEKPKSVRPGRLRRLRDVAANPRVTLVVDHYVEDWSELGWVQVRGTAARVDPGEAGHDRAVAALRGKYDQYADHALGGRPVIRIDPGSVRSWGRLDRDADR